MFRTTATVVQYQVSYLEKIIPKIRRAITTENIFFGLVILVVEENGALSEADGYYYCILKFWQITRRKYLVKTWIRRPIFFGGWGHELCETNRIMRFYRGSHRRIVRSDARQVTHTHTCYLYVHKCVEEKSAESQQDRIKSAALNIYRTRRIELAALKISGSSSPK